MSMENIARHYLPAIAAYFRRRVANASEVDDLTQDVMMALARRGQTAEIANLEGYIFQIAANLLKDRNRRDRRRPLLYGGQYDDAVALLADELSPERIISSRESYSDLILLLNEMPERMRTIFILNRLEDMTGREIAQRLNLSVSTVEKNMMRALAMVRERLS